MKATIALVLLALFGCYSIIILGNATEWNLGDLPERAGYASLANVEGATIWTAEK